ncbi:MAG: hypothetical protein AAF658_04430, partial [Myxococcota bacterium]
MTIQHVVSATAALAHLGIATLAFLFHRSMRLGRVCGALALAFSIWIIADVAADFLWHDFFETLDETAVCLAAAFGVDTILTFIGQRQNKRRWLVACYVWFIALATLTALGWVYPPFGWFASSQTWSALMLGGLLIFGSYSFFLATRYAVHAAAFDERQRARTVLLGIAIGLTLAPVDALRTLSPAISSKLPPMSDLGSLFVTVLLYAVVSKARVRNIELATHRTFQALILIGVLSFVSGVSLFALRDDVVTSLAVSATATAVLILVTYHWVQLTTEDKARTRNLATLG